MEGRKESKYNLAGTCPECGKLIKVEHIIAVDIVEPGTTTKVEEKDNVAGSEIQSEKTDKTNSKEGKDNADEAIHEGSTGKGTEGAGVRPDNPKGTTGTENSVPEPTDSGKSKANKRSGGKTK